MLSRAAQGEATHRICTFIWGIHRIPMPCWAPDCARSVQQFLGPLAYSERVEIPLGFCVGIRTLPQGEGTGKWQSPLGRVWCGTDHRSIELLCADFQSGSILPPCWVHADSYCYIEGTWSVSKPYRDYMQIYQYLRFHNKKMNMKKIKKIVLFQMILKLSFVELKY